ncbi:MAG: hypothetical protein ABIC91_01350 [Nanoarchaeota archaeon]|nr:hypothetical protein [Nanoarchaeota archaeon]MBU1029873.1 hypothetical protein [Nanoarchaeota archaeon]MBU1849277.1 hypothetical protein [Nanoarchaeota archaeon]
MKKAQIQQTFIYILTIILVGIILLIGYKSIGSIMSKGCDVEKTTFKSDIKALVERYNSYGSLNREEMNAPCDYSKVCFVDANEVGVGTFTTTNKIIKDSVNAGIEQNIFLIKEGSPSITEPIGFSEAIKVDSKIICINETNNKFKIQFEGTGKYTKISNQ